MRAVRGDPRGMTSGVKLRTHILLSMIRFTLRATARADLFQHTRWSSGSTLGFNFDS